VSLLVNDTTPRVQYTASASQTTFAYPFEIFEDADLKVYQTLSGADPDDDTDILTLTTNYTVTNAGVSGGGDVVLVTGAAAGDIITIERDLAVKRVSDYQNLGDLASESFNDDLDKLIMMVQQVESDIANLCLKTQVTSAAGSLNLPILVNDKYLTTDGTQLLWGTPEGAAGAIGNLVEDVTPQLGGPLDCNSQPIRQSKGTDIASATALAIGADGNYFDVTGTTTITSISTTGVVGTVITLHFDDAVTLTHHATDLIIPGAANYTTSAGDEFEFTEYASGDWRCTGYALASGEAITAGKPTNDTAQSTASGTSKTFSGAPSGTKKITISFNAVSLDSTNGLQLTIGDSGGLETSGYTSRTSTITGTNTCEVLGLAITAYFAITPSKATPTYNGSITLTNEDGNHWILEGNIGDEQNSNVSHCTGRKELSGEFTQLSVAVSGGNFDGGSINIQYQ